MILSDNNVHHVTPIEERDVKLLNSISESSGSGISCILSELVRSPSNSATIWVILYMSMAFAVWLIWINPNKSEKIIYIYFIHLLINASWSVVFFALHQIFLALVVIVIILLLVLWLIKLYYPINKLSSFLMMPYLVWLVFAFILNLNILLLN